MTDELLTFARRLARRSLRQDDMLLAAEAEKDDRLLRAAEAQPPVQPEPAQAQQYEAGGMDSDDLAVMLDRILGRMAEQGRYVP